MRDITTDLFREETISTSTHKFRNPEDVVTPFLYSGVIRAVDPVTRIHPKYHVEVTIEPEDEMSKFVLLSLHGIPKPPRKEQVCARKSVPELASISSALGTATSAPVKSEFCGD
jgi:hypothetical protein|eukprot:COSAG02_NODE_1_length_108762_cov_456.708287_8_plen_114_part_00